MIKLFVVIFCKFKYNCSFVKKGKSFLIPSYIAISHNTPRNNLLLYFINGDNMKKRKLVVITGGKFRVWFINGKKVFLSWISNFITGTSY